MEAAEDRNGCGDKENNHQEDQVQRIPLFDAPEAYEGANRLQEDQGEESNEVLVVAFPDAVVDEGAMVVEEQDAVVARFAVRAARRAVYFAGGAGCPIFALRPFLLQDLEYGLARYDSGVGKLSERKEDEVDDGQKDREDGVEGARVPEGGPVEDEIDGGEGDRAGPGDEVG